MPLDPYEIIKQRNTDALKKGRLNKQFDLKTLDQSAFDNSIPNNLKLQGSNLLPNLFMNQAGKVVDFVTPGLTSILAKFGLEDLPEDINNLSIEEAQQKYCPTKEQLDTIIEERNNIVNYLNNIGEKIDALSVTVEFGAGFANLLQGLISRISTARTAANLVMSFIPLALPGAVPAAINTLGDASDKIKFNEDGTPRLPPLTITASAVSPSVGVVQSSILKAVEQLNKIDALVKLCNPFSTLTDTSKTISDTAEYERLAEDSTNSSTYKGFILEIETRAYTDTVNQNRAVGKNQSNIILISTEYSFASDPNVLINELKFIIDRDDLKAY